jgi:hypothetical protein
MPWYVSWAPTPWNGRLVVFIGPNTILGIGEKFSLSVAHRTVWWGHRTVRCPCPVCLAIGLTPQVTVGAAGFYTGQSTCHTGQSGGFSPPVPPGTSRWATVPWCTRQSSVWHRTVRCFSSGQSASGNTCLRFLDFAWYLLIFTCDLHNVFFWGVSFLNALVQVTLASCELQT